MLIAFKMGLWHVLMLAGISIAVLHAFVYVVEFRGHATVPRGTPLWNIFLRFTFAGYGWVLFISLFILWTFGRTEGTSWMNTLVSMIVLGFPASLGAAVARLIL